ncbi:MAG TPA: DNA mismatch repair protein MutS [Anaerolineae bacterium]|nr:DNA mismatch repair protein MutS [Anaerolineae bacterium]
MSRKITPIRKQYLEIKRRYPDAILFFRLGDFYETFDEDAEITSRELDIVLTSRNVAKGDRVPMAGIPHHAIDNYLARLIEKGYHVAICEQVGDGPVNGLFPREVVRVVTPGTVVEPDMLPSDSNNFLAAVVADDESVGIAYVDITTGEFATTQIRASFPQSAIRHELTRLQPAEVIVPESLSLENEWDGHLTPISDWKFEVDRAVETLKDHFGTATLDGFGLADHSLASRAAGAIVDYLKQTQQAALQLLTGLSTYSLDEFMVLDAATRRNLELTETLRTGEVRGSLLGVLDSSVSPMGKRMLRQWIGKPLLDLERIRCRQDQIEALFSEGLLRAELRKALGALGDLERLTNRVAAGVAGPRDLVGLRKVIQNLPPIIDLLEGYEDGALGSIISSLDPCVEVRELLEQALSDEPPATLTHIGVIREGYSQELDGVLASSRDARDWIARLESVERERTGIKNLKVGYNKVFGYYIEVTRANTERVPDEYIRKQTLVNAERYITPEMKEYESLVLNAEDRLREIENRLFKELCQRIAEQAPHLLDTARALARLDVVGCLAETAANKGYVRPEVIEEDIIEIRDGRHPVVEEFLPGSRFVPNDTVYEEDERIRIITGPNMSGKSTYLRQVALIALMTQMGSYIPARSARMGLVDRIFTRIGAQDEIHAGQSTFMVEMVETANILHHASIRSLLILDEIGRGTSTYDGVSIAWAVVEYIHNHPRLRARTLFATHYHELTHLSNVLPGVRNYNVAVSEEGGDVVFLHKIVPGGADKSYGIHVAELAGLPRPVINRAQEILALFEAESRDVRGGEQIPARQMALFPETNPLLEELQKIDVTSLTPLEALNRLYEWQQRFLESDEEI